MSSSQRIAGWMRRQLHQSSARGFLVGLSGGIDSAVVARLAQLAAPGNVLAVLLPCHSDPDDERQPMLVATHFSMRTTRGALWEPSDRLVAEVRPALGAPAGGMGATTPADPLRGRVPLANIKPRLRMATLYFFANTLNY